MLCNSHSLFFLLVWWLQVLEAVQAATPPSSSSSSLRTPQQQGGTDPALSGHTLLLFGGLTPDNTELGGQQLHALWLAHDGSWGVWVPLRASGAAPAPRAYACCQAVSAGLTMIVYGGWSNGSIQGTVDADVSAVDGYLLMCIYLLDVNSLTWRRQPTLPLDEAPKPGHAMAGPSTCPGPRKQAMSCVRRSPVSGHEEFMVLGGCGSDGLADFVPYALDLTSFTWSKGPIVGYLPPSREAPTLMPLSREWLLLLGGRGLCGEPLDDVQRLHLPSMSWKPPLQLCSAAQGAAQRQPGSDTVDFSANACVVVGGSREGAYGLQIVARLEVLLPGPPIVFDAGQQPRRLQWQLQGTGG
ncbi:hypothetical protein COO60DRAFT_889728 [Scenedesmus sp. NREL 46B-D3]|nr:hypothetical protein COO60DRAFT_889728 [Scenedesmus sp. NREL 46B-D3]